MNVVFSVIGTILIVLLKIIGLLLLFLCFLLICPICYKGKAEFGEKLLADGRVCWLFGLIWIAFSYEAGETRSCIRLFGINLQRVSVWWKRRKKTRDGKRNKQKFQESEMTEKGKEIEITGSKKEQPEKDMDLNHREADISMTQCNSENEEKTFEKLDMQKENDTGEEKLDTDEEDETLLKSFWRNIKAFVRFIKGFCGNLKGLWKSICEKADWAREVRAFWKLDNTRRMVCILKDNVLHLWRKLKPKVIRGYVAFGTGDPCTTGQLLGVAAIFYAAYGRGVQVIPDFEEKRLEGELLVKGRILLITILIVLIRIFFSNEWTKFRQEAKQLKEAL